MITHRYAYTYRPRVAEHALAKPCHRTSAKSPPTLLRRGLEIFHHQRKPHAVLTHEQCRGKTGRQGDKMGRSHIAEMRRVGAVRSYTAVNAVICPSTAHDQKQQLIAGSWISRQDCFFPAPPSNKATHRCCTHNLRGK